MKNSVIALILIWMVLAVVNFVSLISPAACLFFTICNWAFAALNASVFVSFVSMLVMEFKERRLAKKYPADSVDEPVVEEPVEEAPKPKKRSKAKPIED